MNNNNKLKKFVSGAEYFLDVVRDNAGNTIGQVRDRAGKIVETIADNLPSVLRSVALTGLITVAGIMVACDLTPEQGTEIEEPYDPDYPPQGKQPEIPGPPKPEFDYHWSYVFDMFPHPMSLNLNQIIGSEVQGNVTNKITNNVIGVAAHVENTRKAGWHLGMSIQQQYWAGDRRKTTKGLPSQEFLDEINRFHYNAFSNGHDGKDVRGFDLMLDTILALDDMVPEADKPLFASYVNALRGVNYIHAWQRTNNDYTTEINLGNGPITIGDLMQNINNNNPPAQYEKSGNYPTTADLKSAAIALLPDVDNAYPSLIEDTLTNMGNIEQLLDCIRRAYENDYDIKFNSEAVYAICDTIDRRNSPFFPDDIWLSDILIDKPQMQRSVSPDQSRTQ